MVMETNRNKTDVTAKPARVQRDPVTGHFLPGNTVCQDKGGGRRKIDPNDRTKAHMKRHIQKKLHDIAGDAIDTLHKNAKNGDTVAAKAILDRVAPSLKAVEHTGIDPENLPRMVIDAVNVIAEHSARVNAIDVEPVDKSELSTDQQAKQLLKN